MKVTRDDYELAIPKCCSYRTIEDHEDIMLCWGLLSAIEKGEIMNCSGCDEVINFVRCDDFVRIE